MAGPSNPPVGGNTILPVKTRSGPKVIKPPHASTPHSTSTTTTKNAPSWLSTSALTPKQIQDEATAQANASIAPQVQGLQGQQGAYDAEQKAYQAAMTGFYSALAPYMAGIQGHVSDAYNSAAQTMGDIGHGYAGVLGSAAAADNAATNAALARGGQAPIAAPGSGLTDAFAATHGGIDGSSFAQQGAAKAADAANAPAVWAAQGRDSMTAAIQKAVDGDKGFQDQIAKVYATVPALRNQIVAQIQSAELDKQKLVDQEKNTAFNQAAKRVSLSQSGARLTLAQQSAAFDQKYKVAGLKLRGQALQLQANKFAQSVYNSDRNYQLALERVGISNKRLQLSALSAEYKLSHGGFDQKAVNKFNSLLQQGLNGITVTNNPDGTTTYTRPDPRDKTGKKMVPTDYASFISQAVAHGVPPSLAIARADKFFPPEDRPQGPNPLGALLGTSGGPGRSADVLQAANSMLGIPYSWGGGNAQGPTKGVGRGANTVGFDCSGFIQCVMAKAGVQVGGSTFEQVKQGKPVKLSQLKPGDAIFTEPGKNGPNHVGLYIGNGMVQESPHTGDVNKIIPLKDFLSGGFVAARRYLP